MWGQGTTALITGIVNDPSGAPVPNAELSLRSLSTSAVVKAASGSDGYYTFPGLVAGVYELTVSVKGFREYIQRGISVNLDQQVRLDVSLELGTTAEAVEVSANASPLNYESGVQKGTIQPGTLEELPLILGGHTRSAVAFARLLPGVTTGGG
jgi:Carboxypeptidase regulatory-like domain